MSICITRSKLTIPHEILNFNESRGTSEYNYYYSEIEGRQLSSLILDETCLSELISYTASKDSRLLLLKHKEGIYEATIKQAESEDDKVCFSQEYYAMKSSITEPLFRSLLITDDYELFIIRAELVGNYDDISNCSTSKVSFIIEYVDSVYNTKYADTDFSSLQVYLNSRNDLFL